MQLHNNKKKDFSNFYNLESLALLKRKINSVNEVPYFQRLKGLVPEDLKCSHY